MLFVGDVILTLIRLIPCLRHGPFCKCLTLYHYKVNESKCNVLSIDLDPHLASVLCKQFSFTWSPSSMSYFVIKLTTPVSNLFQANHAPLLQTTRQELDRLAWYYLSWSGRIAVFKMLILAKIL